MREYEKNGKGRRKGGISDDKEGGEREENKGTETESADVMKNLL